MSRGRPTVAASLAHWAAGNGKRRLPGHHHDKHLEGAEAEAELDCSCEEIDHDYWLETVRKQAG